ncbi:MAG: heavy metal translocating P-type ATPase, partial [Acidiferrobacterales bacterium]|nr:heavy metal translocating P-type ATPase [Acidiferrobacterales bacterium]
AVAQAIVDNGLEAYYRQRTETGTTGNVAAPGALDALALFDKPEVQKSFVRDRDNLREASLILEGIHCAACIWLNEQYLQQLRGVHSVNINYATHRASVTWDDSVIHLSDILQAIQSIGYNAHPYDPSRQQALLEKEKRDYLKRLGLAGALGMQVMILAVAMYVGDWSGMESGYRKFFTWLSLLLTLPILGYSAMPFLRGAWRDLRRRHAGMDVPVSLGITLAFLGSTYHTLIGSGHVYYDSVSMFVFFLLSARYLEMQARKHSAESSEALMQSIPVMARHIDPDDGRENWVAAASLVVGDRIRISPGESVATDGRVVDAATSVDESLLTGESTPVKKSPGDEVIGGSVNIGNPVTVQVTRIGEDTVLSSILRLVETAQRGRPRISQLADRIAGWFVSAILLLALATALYWYFHNPAAWLSITVSVLVVTCPCALSLATPTALTAATGVLTRLGLVPSNPIALDKIAHTTTVLFDKTGTLTYGQPGIVRTTCHSGLNENDALHLASLLERDSVHPIAKAFQQADKSGLDTQVSNLEHVVAGGICGLIDGRRYCIGNFGFLQSRVPAIQNTVEPNLENNIGNSIVHLADEDRVLASFVLQDKPREGAAMAIQQLHDMGIATAIVSGDRAENVSRIGAELGIDKISAGLSPDDKLNYIQALQQHGDSVLMVGDGINDAPVLAAADVSVAMGAGTQIAISKADYILMNDQLPTVVKALQLTRKTLGIIRQNLAWAVLYNILAIPAAAIGLVPPWLAALGMSASSLIVVVNALRLTRFK